MVPYFSDRQLDLRRLLQNTSGAHDDASASIVLDQNVAAYTNHDTISGKVYVRVTKHVQLTNVVVKLEGESTTTLVAARGFHDDRARPHTELHKVLYQLKIVYPPSQVVADMLVSPGRFQFVLVPGSYEYPFMFRLPLNNSCSTAKTAPPSFNLATLSTELSRPPQQHTKTPLPPTFTGMHGDANIKYFVKATISRPSALKQNIRSILPFVFCPLDPGTPEPPSSREVFARRKHAFTPSEAKGLLNGHRVFGSKKSSGDLKDATTTHISLESRLPQPPVLTLNREIPLRLVCSLLQGSGDNLTLQALEISLTSHTDVRAQGIVRVDTQAKPVCDRRDLNTSMDFRNQDRSWQIDDSMWRGQRIPTWMPPSFTTCNMTLTYELLIRARVRQQSSHRPPHDIVSELRMPVQLHSGIKPAPQTALSTNFGSSLAAPAPVSSASAAEDGATATEQAGPPAYMDAPPSYEDAIADQVPSVASQPRSPHARLDLDGTGQSSGH